MKKKILIPILLCAVLIVGALCFMFINNNSNKIVSTITMDINPSIEINLNKEEQVISTKALNEDAKEIVNDNLNGKKLDDVIKSIADNVVEKGYAKDGEVVVLLNAKGNTNAKSVEDKIKNILGEKQVHTDVIVIENITKEDEEFARNNNISSAKAAYINSIVKENQNISIETLVEKSTKELEKTKTTGKYCDKGYTLDGDFCLKEIERVPAKDASVCPNGYEEVKGVCYKASNTVNEEYCKNNLKLENGKCVGTDKVDAKGKCEKGEYNSKTNKCEVLTLVGDATKTCNEADDLLLSNGKCASHKPGAHSYGDNDEPFNEETECCCGGTFHTSPNPDNPGMGWCYNMSGDYIAKVTCASGQTLKDGKCYKAEASNATYYCDKGTLEGNKCVTEVERKADTKPSCENGLTLHENRVCIDKNSTKEKVEGYKCEKENSKLDGTTCIVYEILDAKTN